MTNRSPGELPPGELVAGLASFGLVSCGTLTVDDALRLILGQLVAVEGRVELAGLLHQVNVGELLGMEQLRRPQNLQSLLGGVAVPVEGADRVLNNFVRSSPPERRAHAASALIASTALLRIRARQ